MKKIRNGSYSKDIARKIVIILCLSAIFAVLFTLTAFADGATTDMFTKAKEIIVDVYSKIAGISTVLAALMSAVAVIGAKLSSNQHKVDMAWDWLRRIWVAWIVINGIGAFLAFLTPYFRGLNTLDNL